jgi:hypothetical protein
MNKSEFDKKISTELSKAIAEVAQKAAVLAKYEQRIQQILAVVNAVIPNNAYPHDFVHNSGDRLWLSLTRHRVPNFEAFSRIAEALDLLGLPIEGWKTEESTSAIARRRFIYNTPEIHLELDLWLSDDAKCEIVEKAREPQPDKIIYELRCAGDDDKSTSS